MLRLGVMLDSYSSSRWILRTIEEIQSSTFARVELVVLNPSGPVQASRQNPLFRLYQRLDYTRNKVDRDALAPADLLSCLRSVPSVSGSSPEEILPFTLDVLLRFGSRPAQRELFAASRFGIWSSYPSGSGNEAGSPDLFWEVFDRNPVSESWLHLQTAAEDFGKIAFRSYATTDHASLYRTRNPICWKVGQSLLRALRELDLRGIAWMQSLPDSTERSPATQGRPLNNAHMLWFVGLEAKRWLKARIEAFRSSADPKWCIGIRPRTAGRRFDDPANYKLMPSASDRFYADPFLFERDGKTYLFFEDFRYAEGRALISCCEVDAEGTPGAPFEVLRRPYHLSYPFLFEEQGELYMIPETRGNRTVELYRAKEFPFTWVSEGVLLQDIYAVDATIQKIDGTLWMFVGLSNGDFSNSDELALFSAPALRGPWTPHPCNPVVSDVQRARPAGMLFYEDGRLIRPSQDCGKAYGYGLVFSEVLTLTQTDYREQPIRRLNPEDAPHALANHTYNRTQRFEVIDRTLPAAIANKP